SHLAVEHDVHRVARFTRSDDRPSVVERPDPAQGGDLVQVAAVEVGEERDAGQDVRPPPGVARLQLGPRRWYGNQSWHPASSVSRMGARSERSSQLSPWPPRRYGAAVTTVAWKTLRGELERGLTLPASWYADAEILRLEQERIFRRSWHYAGPLEQVAEPGA